MKTIKEYLPKLKPWLILSTYIIFLLFIVLNFNSIIFIFNKYFAYFTPFNIAIAIAYVLNIPMKQIEKLITKYIKKKSIVRPISITLTIILAIAIISFFSSMIFPQLFQSIGTLISNLTIYINSLLANIDKILAFFKLDSLDLSFDAKTINDLLNQFGLNFDTIVQNATSWVSGAGLSIMDFVNQFTGVVLNWFLAFMFSIYLLSSKEILVRQLKKFLASILPYDFLQETLRISRISNEIFTNFVSGQLVEACIIGILIYLMMIVLKMPFAILVACITSVLALVPVFGATLAMCFGAILILSVNPIQAFWFIVGYQVVQQFENSVIYPRVVGKSVGLPGLWTLVSIFIFGSMFGVIGMLIAVPATSCVYTIGSEYINNSLAKRKLVVGDDVTKVEEIKKIDENLDK